MLLLSALLLAAAAPAADGKNERAAWEVEALERRRFKAQVTEDHTFLKQALADDLLCTHSNGAENDKIEYLQSIRDGKSRYDKIEGKALHMRAYHDGTTAIVNGTVLITLPNKLDGTPSLARLKYVVAQVKDRQKG